MKKTAVIILSMVLILSLSACESKSKFGAYFQSFFKADEPQDSNIENEKKEVENSITIGVTMLDSYNPLMTVSPTTKAMLGFIFEPMFGMDSDMHTVGVLAESYNTAIDGRSIKINLKKGVKWHDGTDFTAADVAYTINAIKKYGGSYKSLVKNMTYVSCENNYTVNIKFDRSVPEPASLLIFPIIKNASVKDDYKPIGTGPFYLNYDKLSAFNEYHGNPAKLSEIKIKSVPDDEKFVSLFNASVIDVANSDILDMKTYTPRSNSQVYDIISNKMVLIGFNAKNPVFSFPEARRSVSMLLDRKNVATHIYFSRAVATNYPINPSSEYYPKSAGKLNTDSGAVEKELADNGWKKDKRGVYYYADNNGMTYFSINILVNSESEERVTIAENLSSEMTKNGLRNSVLKCSGEEFEQRILDGDYDCFIGEVNIQPNNDLTDMVCSNSNMFGFADNETDILLSQLGTLTSKTDKQDISLKLYERIKSECPFAPICFLKDSVVTSAKLKGGVSPSIENFIRQTEEWSVK